jgi:hypothetical protein
MAMAKALHNKGFPLYDDIADLVDGTRATGLNAFRAGQSTPALGPSTQNTAELASTSYDPNIDPELQYVPLEGERVSDVEMDCEAPQVISISTMYTYNTHYYNRAVLIPSTRRKSPCTNASWNHWLAQ